MDLHEAYTRSLPANGPLEDVAELRPSIDLFFDKIMVNAPDPDPREPIEHVERHAPQIFIDRRFLGDRNLRRRHEIRR